jgi:hypothetical protein
MVRFGKSIQRVDQVELFVALRELSRERVDLLVQAVLLCEAGRQCSESPFDPLDSFRRSGA